MVAVLILAAVLGVASAANTPEELAAEQGFASMHNGQGSIYGTEAELTPAPLTLLPQDKSDESPACLDGSPYGFYFVPSTTGSTKWTISLEGGGWCYDEELCYQRSQMHLGSSTKWAKTRGCGCMNTVGDGLDRNCNCLFLPYGDGASFSGYRAKPWPVPGVANATLTFRGIKNLDASLDWAFAHGLDKATEFVLTGGSAGGLSTFLHADRVAARVQKAAPGIKKNRAAPVVGYFLDHDNFQHTTGSPDTPSWTKANYTDWMKYIYHMQNLTFGPDGGLTEQCRVEQVRAGQDPALCFMSPHMHDTIQTPFFVFNSKYDQWQLSYEFQSKWTTEAEQEGVIHYGTDFMRQFQPVAQAEKNGAFITSCICHGCPWYQLSLEGKTSYQHYAAWMAGTTTGAASIHIDTRLPNGGGKLTGNTYRQCAKFPGNTEIHV